MSRQNNNFKSNSANIIVHEPELNFGDVLASTRPQTADEVAARWIFLKNENRIAKDKAFSEDTMDAIYSTLFILLWSVAMVSISLILAP